MAQIIFSVFVGLGIVSFMLTIFFTPLEGTGAMGRIPTRVNKIMQYVFLACMAMALIAYWLK